MAEKTSSALDKESNYKCAAAVSSGSHLRIGLLSLQGLNDARRTSVNLEALAVTPSAGLAPSECTLQCYGGWRRQTVRVWLLVHPLITENIQHCEFFYLTCSPASPELFVCLQISSLISQWACISRSPQQVFKSQKQSDILFHLFERISRCLKKPHRDTPDG